MKIFIAILMLSTMLFAENNNSKNDKKSILDKHIQKEMENEKKYANEQKFYNAEEYDFKGAEVNEESLKSINVIEPDPNAYNSDFMDMPN